MNAAMKTERDLGYEPRDVSKENLGYDVESRVSGTGTLRFIEVKGRAIGADTVSVTRNEILTALNKQESFVLAIVEVDRDSTGTHYLLEPFDPEPDFAATSVNFNIGKLLQMSDAPLPLSRRRERGSRGSMKEIVKGKPLLC